MNVYLLHHSYERERCGCDEVKLVGVFETEAAAAEVQDRLKGQPGFVDQPQGWSIDEYRLGVVGWAEGFVTVHH